MAKGETADRLWTRDFVLSFVTNFLLGLIFYLLMTTMALYAVERFGAADSMAGLAASAFVIGATLARLFAGSLIDLAGRRRMLLVSLVVYTLAAASYVPAGSLGLLIGIRFVHGVSFGMASTAAIAIAQSLIPATRRAEGTSYFSVSTVLGTALGPALALQLVDGPGYPALFTVSTVAAGLALAIALVLRVPAVHIDRRTTGHWFRLSNLLDPAVLPVASLMLLMGASYSSVVAFLNPYAQKLNLGAVASTFFLVYSVVLFVSRLVAGRLQDRRGDNIVIYPALVSFALGLLLLSRATGQVAVIVAGGLIGLGFGTVMSALQAVAVAQVPPHRFGIAVSTFYFLTDSGVGLGPVVLGWLLQFTDYRAMYLVVGIVVAASVVAYHFLHGCKHQKPSVVSAGRAPAEPVRPGGDAAPVGR